MHGTSPSIPTRHGRVPVEVRLERHHRGAVLARDPRERHRRHRLLHAAAGTGAQFERARARRPASGCCCTSAPSTTRATRLGQRPARRASTRAATRRSPSTSPTSLDGDGGADASSVRADDDPHDLAKPRGKQDWQLEPHSIWYPRTTGIWQTVWLETRARAPGSTSCAGRRTSSAGRSASRRCDRRRRRATTCGSRCSSARGDAAARRRHATRWSPARCTAASRCPIPASTTTATSCSGAPQRPTLIDAELRAAAASAASCSTTVDELHRAALDRRPGRPLRAQRPAVPAAHGARPGLLARDAADRARRRGAARATSSWPRRWASTACASTRRSRTRATSTGPTGSACWSGRRCRAPTASRATSIERAGARVDRGRSSATTAIPASSPGCRSTSRGACRTCRTAPAQRHYVQALYHLTKTLDPTRPVIGNDGWESVATDIIGIHDYDADPERMRAALRRRRSSPRSCSSGERPGRARPDARRLPAPRPADHADRVRRHRLSARRRGGTWGYSRADSAEEFGRALRATCSSVVRSLPLLSRASATRSSPTPTRRPTACSTPTARRSSRSSEIAAATMGSRILLDAPRPEGSQPVSIPTPAGSAATEGAEGA